jgi:hypothetical protein
MPFCTTCGAQQPENAAFCAICGAALAVAAPQPPQPLTCPRCGAQFAFRRPDSFFCDMCGASLGRAGADVIHPPTESMVQPDAVVQQDVYAYARSPEPAQARLVVQESQTTLHLPQGKVEIIIGRDDPISNLFPDIDLTDYGGDKAGVSRQHARILFQSGRIFLEDRNSTNRTYLNEQPLEPWQPYPLHNGDEIRFGRLKVRFYL